MVAGWESKNLVSPLYPETYSVQMFGFRVVMSCSLARLLAACALSWEALVRESTLDFASFAWFFNVIQ